MSEPGPKPRVRSRFVTGLALCFGALVCAGGTGAMFPLQAALLLALGWAPFLRDALPAIQWEPAAIAGGLATLGLALALGQALMRSLAPGWPLRRTLRWGALVVLMFVAGTAGAGVVHQLGWLALRTDPVIESSFDSMWADRYAEPQALCEHLAPSEGLPLGQVSRALWSDREVGQALESVALDLLGEEGALIGAQILCLEGERAGQMWRCGREVGAGDWRAVRGD